MGDAELSERAGYIIEPDYGATVDTVPNEWKDAKKAILAGEKEIVCGACNEVARAT
jgi:hypothetical protein